MPTWVNGVEIGWTNGKCNKCHLPRTDKGHDPCIANLPNVKYACCGHGNSISYCVWDDDTAQHWMETKKGTFEELTFRDKEYFISLDVSLRLTKQSP